MSHPRWLFKRLTADGALAGGGMLDPLSLPGLEFYVRSDMGVLNAAGTPAQNGQAVATWTDLSPFGQNVTQAVVANRPTYATKATPGGMPAVAFAGGDGGQQLSWVPGFNRFLSASGGYTCYWYFNELALNTGGSNGQFVFDVSLGQGFRNDAKFAGAAATTVEYNPGSFGMTLPKLGWQMWSWVAFPPSGVGQFQVFQDDVQVGPTSGPYGPLTQTTWNMALEDQFIISGNPAGNDCLLGQIGACILFSRAHDETTRRGVERFLKGQLG